MIKEFVDSLSTFSAADDADLLNRAGVESWDHLTFPTQKVVATLIRITQYPPAHLGWNGKHLVPPDADMKRAVTTYMLWAYSQGVRQAVACQISARLNRS